MSEELDREQEKNKRRNSLKKKKKKKKSNESWKLHRPKDKWRDESY